MFLGQSWRMWSIFFYKIDSNLILSGGAGFMEEIMYTLHNI